MPGKWRTAILVWTGILLYFGLGSFHPKEADLFLIAAHSMLLLAAGIYTLGIWMRDRKKGAPEKAYHLSAYPQSFLRFAFDEKSHESEPPVPQAESGRSDG